MRNTVFSCSSFTARFTSGSSAHSSTSCPMRAACSASAVPHAPPPSTAMRVRSLLRALLRGLAGDAACSASAAVTAPPPLLPPAAAMGAHWGVWVGLRRGGIASLGALEASMSGEGGLCSQTQVQQHESGRALCMLAT